MCRHSASLPLCHEWIPTLTLGPDGWSRSTPYITLPTHSVADCS